MPDYKGMYHKISMAAEAAIDILIDVQNECEELYINLPEPEVKLFQKAEESDCPEDLPETGDHIRRLFEQAQPFGEGELSQDPEYRRFVNVTFDIEYKMQEIFGEEAHELLQDFLNAYFEVEQFDCLHYFHQGYLAAQAELKKDPDE